MKGEEFLDSLLSDVPLLSETGFHPFVLKETQDFKLKRWPYCLILSNEYNFFSFFLWVVVCLCIRLFLDWRLCRSLLSLLWDSESLAWKVDLGILPVKLNKMRTECDSLIYNCPLYCDPETSLMSVNNFAIRLNTPGNVRYIIQGRWGKTSSTFTSWMCSILWPCLDSHKGNEVIPRSQYLYDPTPPLLFVSSLSPELNWSLDPQNYRRESHSNQMVKSWNCQHGILSNRSHWWLFMTWTLSQLRRWNIGPRYGIKCWLRHLLIYGF